MPRDKDTRNGPPRGTRGAARHIGKGRAGGGGGREERPARAGGKSFGAKKPFGDKKPYGEKKAFGDKPFGERKGGDRPRFDRSAPPRGRDDRPERAPRKDFSPRGERGGDESPRFKPREDRGDRNLAPRGDRRDARPEGARDKRPFTGKGYAKAGDRPRSGDFRKDGDKPFARGPRPEGAGRGGDKPWQRRAAPARDDARREGGRDDRRPPREDRPRRDGDERPRFSKRFERSDRTGGEDRAPRKFNRPREDGDRATSDRPRGERPTFARPRGGRDSWGDHPRSDARAERPRGEQDDSRIFVKRPAFGGRGAYRERKPDADRRAARPAVPEKTKPGERIAKRLARAGLCSRRDAEEWIMQGRVAVNGRVLTSPALDVTERDVITVDGQPLPERERTRLFLYHKPRGLMTTHADPEGRPTVFDNLPEGLPRLISVGRLDFNTEGLLLLTNDGGLARALELPDTGWLRRYRVRAHGDVTQAQLDALRDGVEVDGVKYGSIDAKLERDQGANVWIVFAIREGKNREVRNVLAHLGLEVNRLIRVSYGPFQLAELGEGEVEEVKTRVLREQLGEKIAAMANADFQLPVKSGAEEGAAAPAEKKPRTRTGLIADSKGRRVLVQRSGEREEGGERPYRRPKRGYHGKRDIKPRED